MVGGGETRQTKRERPSAAEEEKEFGEQGQSASKTPKESSGPAIRG